MDDVWARRVDEARAAYVSQTRELEDREVRLQRELRDLGEAYMVMRESMHVISSVAGEAFSAKGEVFGRMQAELSELSDRAVHVLNDGEDRARDELRTTRIRIEEVHEQYVKTLRAIDEERASR